MNRRVPMILLALALLPMSATALGAKKVNEFCNPLDVPVADPMILKDGDTYYAYGTRDSERGFETFSSKDLVNWRREGFCFEKNEKSWGQRDFWAPEVIRRGDKWYLFYTAHSPVAKRKSICVAVADSPKGPFVDVAAPLVNGAREYIDGHPFYDEASRRHYLYVCRFEKGGGSICVARLSRDLLSVETDFVKVFGPDQPYDFHWVEAPFVIKHKDLYYMTYSRNGFASPLYGVCYATAPSPKGPWTKFDRNPILTRTRQVSGPGHNCLIASPDGNELFIAYHTHFTFAGGGARQLAIDRLRFVPNGGGPDRLELTTEIPTVDPQPLPSGSKPMLVGRSDNFESNDMDWSRWGVYFEQRGKWRLQDGKLRIETVGGDIHQEQADAANIFLQYAPCEDFRIRTKVKFTPQANYEQAMLIVWQDGSNYIRFATVYADAPKFEVGCELNGSYDPYLAPNDLGSDVYLQIEKTGYRYLFSYSADGERWTQLPVERRADLKHIQVGLGAIAPGSGAERVAEFDFFDISELRASKRDKRANGTGPILGEIGEKSGNTRK